MSQATDGGAPTACSILGTVLGKPALQAAVEPRGMEAQGCGCAWEDQETTTWSLFFDETY